jgi:CDP-glycerol glycerophosphotransferase (TagB/SpsB family)
MLNKLFKLIIYTLNIPLYWISYFIPKKKDLWIFGAWFGNKYADNSKYLYEFIYNNKKDISPVWLTDKRDVFNHLKSIKYPVSFKYSLYGYWLSARAEIIIVSTGMSDVNRYVSTTEKKIMLWHGTLLKTYDIKPYFEGFKYEVNKIIFPFNISNYEKIISTSEEVSKIYRRTFQNIKDVAITGYPRNDRLGHEIDKFSKIVTYLPTHRGEGNGKILKLFDTFDIEIINESFKRIEYVLKIKLHYYDLMMLKFNDMSNIKFIRDDTDVMDLMSDTHILITDYSGAYFDFLLTQRPIVFAAFDIDDYMMNDRAFNYDYDEIICGPKCSNWDEVMNAVSKYIEGDDKYEDKRKEMNHKFNECRDFNFSENVYEMIKNLVVNNKLIKG